MNAEELENFLYQDESAVLDFKEMQYKFEKASKDDKSEIIKDIIGFANAWRGTDAYILIGIRQEKNGEKHTITGCNEHIADHSLQELVNSKVNRPIIFSYEIVKVNDEYTVDVIKIPLQERPFWLVKDYGRLKKDTVYVRRSSSTRLDKTASLEEIERMRQADSLNSCSLSVEFCNEKGSKLLGNKIQHSVQYLSLPSLKSIPHYVAKSNQSQSMSMDVHRVNKNFYREYAEVLEYKLNYKPVYLAIVNKGMVYAEDICLELNCSIENIRIVDKIDYKTKLPRKRVLPPSNFGRITKSNVSTNNETWNIVFNVPNLQAGRKTILDVFYISCSKTKKIEFEGEIYSKNLSRPIDVELEVELDVESNCEMTTEKLIEFTKSNG